MICYTFSYCQTFAACLMPLQCCFADLRQKTGKDSRLVWGPLGRDTALHWREEACPCLLKSSLSERTLQMLRAARTKVQQISRRCANDFWLQLCSHIQVCADTGNFNGIYDGIKQAIGPMQSRIAPLKSATGDAIKDKSKQIERWVEHYSELYSRM